MLIVSKITFKLNEEHWKSYSHEYSSVIVYIMQLHTKCYLKC